jgi:hypothetical protein
MERFEAIYLQIPTLNKPTPLYIAFNQNDLTGLGL